MLKQTKSIISVSRKPTDEFVYQCDSNDAENGIITINPIIYDKAKDKTWTLAPTEETGANPNTISYVPGIDFDGDGKKNRLDAQWYLNLAPVEGDTRYLRPDEDSLLQLSTQVGPVTVDPIPPEIVDNTSTLTDYISLSPTYNIIDDKHVIVSDSARHFEYQFKDESGLDYKQFTIKLKVPDSYNGAYQDKVEDGYILLYDFSRPETSIETYKGTYFPDYDNKWIVNTKISYYKKNTYVLEFDLISGKETKSYGSDYNKKNRFFASPSELLKIGYTENDPIPTDLLYLNTIPDNVTTIKEWIDYIKNGNKCSGNIVVDVWDLAGNYTEYFDETQFDTLDIDDLMNLDKVQIKFYNFEPETLFVTSNVNGSVRCNCQDPNISLWNYPVVAYLTEQSVGQIDMSTYDFIEYNDPSEIGGYNVLTGQRDFKVHNITEYGYVEVEAWVETGNEKIDELIKERTYNTGRCGPWLVDGGGRKYNIRRFVPSYLKNSDFGDFIEWFELFINTFYMGLDKKLNISGLEKVARVGNFNDIDAIENALLQHYSNEFGNEIPFDKEAISNITNTFNTFSFGYKDEQEVYANIKYVLENLPDYNKFKGTNIGVFGTLKMFSLSCKIINLWVKKENPIEENPNFIEETSIKDFTDLFQTSRFAIDVNSNVSFKSINDNIKYFIEIIKSIKPITKILDSIKYTINIDKDITLINFNEQSIYGNNNVIYYTAVWTGADIGKFLYKVNKENQTCSLLGLPYKLNVQFTNYNNNYYTIFGKLFDNAPELIINCDDGNSTRVTYKININDLTISLNNGLFILQSYKSDAMLSLYKIYENLISGTGSTFMYIKSMPGSKYIRCY